MADRKLRIGWLTPTTGIFGAVREMIEVSNALIARGHQVTIFSPDGAPIKWIESRAAVEPHRALRHRRLDFAVGIVDWDTELFTLLRTAQAIQHVVCVLGFTPSVEMVQALRGEGGGLIDDRAWRMMRQAYEEGMWFWADSSWQVDFFRNEVNYPMAPPFGGINTVMFQPPAVRAVNRPLRVAHSNDPRERKGTKTVKAALQILERQRDIAVDSYWNRRFTQAQLVAFLQGVDIFLDGHYRAGWCNPVLEAMACGAAVVCTDIGATRDFAIPGQTALTVPPNEPELMARAALRLIDDAELRQRLAQAGAQVAKGFDYAVMAQPLETAMLKRLAHLGA